MTTPTIDWSAFDGPPEYVPERVSSSLARFEIATSDEAVLAARFAVLFAVGNTHAGTIYPAAIGVIDPIAQIAFSDLSPTRRGAALEILVDLVVDSEPAPGYEMIAINGAGVPLSHAIIGRLARWRSEFDELQRDPTASPTIRAAVAELQVVVTGAD